MYKHAVLIGFVMVLSTVAPACGSDYDNGGGNSRHENT